MALIRCYECRQRISDTALNCPNCGAARAKKSTSAIENQVEVEIEVPPNGADHVAFLFGLLGLIFLFIAFPIGISMLMFSGIVSLFGNNKTFSNKPKKKKVKAAILTGNCPNCSTNLQTKSDTLKTSCPACSKPFIVKNSRFYEV